VFSIRGQYPVWLSQNGRHDGCDIVLVPQRRHDSLVMGQYLVFRRLSAAFNLRTRKPALESRDDDRHPRWVSGCYQVIKVASYFTLNRFSQDDSNVPTSLRRKDEHAFRRAPYAIAALDDDTRIKENPDWACR